MRRDASAVYYVCRTVGLLLIRSLPLFADDPQPPPAPPPAVGANSALQRSHSRPLHTTRKVTMLRYQSGSIASSSSQGGATSSPRAWAATSRAVSARR